MTYSRALLAAMLLLLLLAGCEQTSVGDQEQIAQRETVLAGTPSPTFTPTVTLTPEPSATVSPTVGPSPTSPPTPTPAPPTITPLPPTPTPNPALNGFSFCNQQVGEADGGRFSAQLTNVQVQGFPAFERVTMTFTETVESAAINAFANCISGRDFTTITGDPAAPGDYLLQLQLPDWLHDQAFNSSAITRTLTYTNTRVVTSVAFRYDAAVDTGAVVEIPLKTPLRFKLALEDNPTRLVLEVARASDLVATSDLLSVAVGADVPELTAPVFFLAQGDVWRTDALTTTNLTRSPEVETALAVSPDGSTLAFCRTAPGVDPSDAPQNVPGVLLIMNNNGQGSRPLSNTGFNCADPVWSLDSKQLAWSVDETGVVPVLRSIWLVSATGGPARRVSGGSDEWSRSAPQWLADGALVYAAQAPDGRSTLFLRGSDGLEQDIGAELVVADRYVRLGRPLADQRGQNFAIEALRPQGAGSDLVLFSAAGEELEVLGSSDGSGEPFWSRLGAWRDDGALIYLTSDCRSTLAEQYSLRVRQGTREEVLAEGVRLGTIGSIAVVGDALVYVLAEVPQPGPRGAEAIDPNSPSVIWAWDSATNQRGVLYTVPRAITSLQR